MISKNIILSAFLFSLASESALGVDTRTLKRGIRRQVVEQDKIPMNNVVEDVPRKLGSSKSGSSSEPDKLFATVSNEHDEFPDASGNFVVSFKDDKVSISYDMEDLPAKCKPSIDDCYISINKWGCDYAQADYWSGSDDEVNPWERTGFSTTVGGRAAGMIFGLADLDSYDKTACRHIAVYGPVKKSSSYSSKSGSSSTEQELLACGILLKEDTDEDYCY